jgi:hypothetical protein
VSYSDGTTPAVLTDYDRMGRVRGLVAGTNALSRLGSVEGLPLGEAWSSRVLGGLCVTNTYQLQRRASLSVMNGAAAVGATTSFGHDAAGRLGAVSDGSWSAACDWGPVGRRRRNHRQSSTPTFPSQTPKDP